MADNKKNNSRKRKFNLKPQKVKRIIKIKKG